MNDTNIENGGSNDKRQQLIKSISDYDIWYIQ